MSGAVRQLEAGDRALMEWFGRVNDAALAFERRWTMAALRRRDSDLARRLVEQRGLWDEASVTGSADAVETHGAAMCRGWQAACRLMEASAEPVDAYLLGRCPTTGFRVAIGPCVASAADLAASEGREVTFLTPDEVATILAGLEGMRAIASIKAAFPGASVETIRSAAI